uniref:Uncharacterized protein n=1 Tax=Cryptomonas curvata TaxID=233186 RepID=A0A7S0QDZ8_9CRYP|mmetsp:Transcript_19712/g.41348  ORF Transcript_19712/g.41348 Transcript_19712/m.41348 type:complete len:115 (+) Transcript_19712:109-453(+)
MIKFQIRLKSVLLSMCFPIFPVSFKVILYFLLSVSSYSSQWWTIGSAGGPAGTTGLTSASWWNHGDTTKAWQQNLASVQSLAEVNVRKPRIATEHKPKQAVSGKTMPGFCSPFC